MNMINKNIRHIVFEIFIIILIVLTSIPVWNNFNSNTSYAKTADYYSDNSYKKITIDKIQDMDLNNMVPMSEQEALTQQGTILAIKNNSGYNVSYNLYLKINKNSTINIKNLNISVNNKTNNLNEIKLKQNDEYYFYLLDTTEVKKHLGNKYDIKLWLDENAGNECQGKTLSYDFMYEDNIK